jgi:LacI family transcriptional regulator
MVEHRAPTIYDVARVARVAPSTVSRAFARPDRVNPATAARIRAVAAELAFRPNPLARALPTGRTSMIAMVVPDLANPACAEIVHGALAAAGRSGYALLLASTDGSSEAVPPVGPGPVAAPICGEGVPAAAWSAHPAVAGGEPEALDRTLSVADGVLVATPDWSDATVLAIAEHRPVVVLDRAVAGVPSVITDNPRGMRQTVAHLAALGHDHVTYLAGPARSWADETRRRALRQVGTEQGVQSRRVGPYPPTVAGGAAAADEVLRQPTTAVITHNDLMATGLIRALADRGLRCPDDVSVVGFDGMFVAELTVPALTTVAAPLRLMGDTAVRHLLAVIGGAPPSAGEPLTLASSLVVRGSTARRRCPNLDARPSVFIPAP